MPGIGVRTAARILLEIGDASAFASSAHLAAYPGTRPNPTRTTASKPPPAGSGRPGFRAPLAPAKFLHSPM
ncbi:transposase [Saccharopolyspora hirsuta]|uniref:transposase n=1 Tax=Saccharopolyspora hirsuta TaxID=1837 RepID=UPI0033195FC9